MSPLYWVKSVSILSMKINSLRFTWYDLMGFYFRINLKSPVDGFQ